MDRKIIRSGRKTIRIEVKDEGLIIKAPWHVTDEEIDSVILKHKDWIEKSWNRLAARRTVAEPPLTPEEIQQLAQKALKIIPERVRYYAEKLDVNYGRITIRNQRSRWGSCSTNGNLNFNCLLMLTPPEVIDSVVVHELCHRKEMNHSKKFYEEVLKVMPDYPIWDKWLKENGGALIKRMTG